MGATGIAPGRRFIDLIKWNWVGSSDRGNSGRRDMKIGARNRLEGEVVNIKRGADQRSHAADEDAAEE